MKVPKLLTLVALLGLTFRSVQAQLFNSLETLNQDNWTELVKPDGTVWLVTFYVPWCPVAQAFSPELEQTAAELKSQGFNIRFGSVDVSTNKELGFNFKIDKSPFVKMFYSDDGNWLVDDFEGEPSGPNAKTFCTNFYKGRNIPYSNLPQGYTDGSVVDLNEDNFESIVLNSNEIWMVAFEAPWCYHCKMQRPIWNDVAKQMGSKVRFGIIDAEANRGLAGRFNVQRLPTNKYFNAGYDKSIENAGDYEGGRTLYEIKSFAQGLRGDFESHPERYAYVAPEISYDEGIAEEACPFSLDPEPVVEAGCAFDVEANVHDESVEEYIENQVSGLCNDGSLCIVAFLQKNWYRQTQINELSYMAAAWKESNVQFFWVEAGSNQACEDELKLERRTNVIAFANGHDTYVQMTSFFNSENLNAFVQQCVDQGLESGLDFPYGGFKLTEDHY